jgi:hypothetical protein
MIIVDMAYPHSMHNDNSPSPEVSEPPDKKVITMSRM